MKIWSECEDAGWMLIGFSCVTLPWTCEVYRSETVVNLYEWIIKNV